MGTISPRSRVKLGLMRSRPLFDAVRRTALVGRFLAGRPHDPDFAAFAKLTVGPGVFLDVGANSGLSALSFRTFDRTRPIVSVEANPHHGRDLAWLTRRLRPFEYRLVAASDRPAQLALHVPFYRGIPLTGEASVEPQRDEDLRWWAERHLGTPDTSAIRVESVEVPAIPLDDLGLDPAIVKIDVEGHEIAVLRGLRQTVERCRPVVFLEVSANYDEICAFLEPLGYRSHYYDASAEMLRPGRSTVNAFFLPVDEAELAAGT